MSKRTDGGNDHNAYLSYNGTVAWLRGLVEESKSNGGFMTMESVGKSYEGRDIWCELRYWTLQPFSMMELMIPLCL